jgi:hypothetical protein
MKAIDLFAGAGGYSHSGNDSRTGRRGRDEYIWVWPVEAATA